jgi:hypothetical protein
VLVVAEIVLIDIAQRILRAGLGIRCHRFVETPGRPVNAGGISPPVGYKRPKHAGKEDGGKENRGKENERKENQFVFSSSILLLFNSSFL